MDTPRPVALDRKTVLSTDGCPIAVWSGGNPEGLPVVLLHGFALDHTAWLPLCEHLGHCHLILPDLRGHGASGRPADRAAYTNGRLWADDLAAVLRLAEGAGAVAVAWSFAGRMLLDYVRHHGTSGLRALNLVAAASIADATASGPDHQCLADLCAEDPDSEARAAKRFLTNVLGVADTGPDYHRFMDVLRQTSTSQRAALRGRPLDYDDLLTQIRIPVLISQGDRDTLVLPRHADALAARIPHARLSVYGGAGHAPFWNDPGRFAAELTEFASQADGWPCTRH